MSTRNFNHSRTAIDYMKPLQEKNWAEYTLALRNGLGLSQEGFAELLQTNQCNVSRWERGITKPNYRMRVRLSDLPGEGSFSNDQGSGASLEKAAQVIIDKLRTPCLLIRRDGIIIATTIGTEYTAGATLRAQTKPDELAIIEEFEDFLEKNSFWETADLTFEYNYRSREENRRNLLTAVDIGGQIYCLIQKIERE